MGNQICCQNTHEVGQIQKLQNEVSAKNIAIHKEERVDLRQIEEIKEEKLQESQPVEEKKQEQHDKVHQQIQQSHHQVEEIYKPVEEQIEIPHLSSKVAQAIQRQSFFQTQFSSISPQTKKYGQDVYVGQLDQEKVRPNGLGKMYKQNGSIYIGNFRHGKAHGRGAFIFKDGSYYQGEFQDNKAETTEGFGEYKSEQLQYTGGFKNNTFHGFGKQTGPKHKYEGHYLNGNRSDGKFVWKGEDGDYEYTGAFDHHNKFHGSGTLIEPLGVYKGQFVEGKKHGLGEYKQSNGVRYVGDYRQNQRTGDGTIFNDDDTIAYKGQLLNGLPHGKGMIKEDNGNIVHANWVQGIDSSVIQP